MEDFLFNKLWQLLYEHGASAKKEEGARRHWSTLTTEQQKSVLDTISRKLSQGKFVQFDPIRAIKENTPKTRLLTLSYNEYYRRYGTTEPRDGWQMANPTGQKVIYVKNGSMLS